MTDQEFEKIVADAMDNIPDKYQKAMNNVGFVVEAEPSAAQREKLHLHDGMLLFGLYEGIPLTKRTGNYSGVLPDKITIFRDPILSLANSTDDVISQVKNTVWHEVAHHFGLDHSRINELENK